jgi:hypothetical protein
LVTLLVAASVVVERRVAFAAGMASAVDRGQAQRHLGLAWGRLAAELGLELAVAVVVVAAEGRRVGSF